MRPQLPARGRVLTVERSLLKRGDPLRKVPYAGGHSYPNTAELRKGNSTPHKAVARCRDVRARLGLTQDDFAKLIGKNHSTIETWESPNPKRRLEPPAWMQQLFGAFMHAQAPNGWELRKIMEVDGPVRAVFWLMRSAFEGPQLRSSPPAGHEARRRDPWEKSREANRLMVAAAQREADAALAADPVGAAAVDAATVVYKK